MLYAHLSFAIALLGISRVVSVTNNATCVQAVVDEIMELTVSEFKTEIAELKTQYDSVVSEIKHFKEELNHGIGHGVSKRIPGGSDGVYAFYAYSSYNQYFSPGHNQAVLFDRVVTNAGTNFNQVTGQFTCKIPGTYVFSWTSYILQGDVPTNLILNDNIVAKSGTLFQATNVCVLYLSRQDVVYVRAEPRGDHNGAVWSWSSFSGFLLS